MVNLIYRILVIILVVGVFSCTRDQGPYIVEPIPEEIVEDTIVDSTSTGDTIDATIFSYTIFFDTDVKPLLAQNCVQGCHNPQHPKLDLRPMVSYDELLTLGASAPYVDTISPAQSILYLHLTGAYTLMPEGGPALSQGKIDTVYTWISQGAQNN